MTNSEMFKKAHKIARQTVSLVGNYSIAFKLALKKVWSEAKNSIDIEALEKKGFNRWTKGDMDRLYFNIEKSGDLDVDYYKTGNVRSAYLNGERISNAEAYRLMTVKCFINLKHDNNLVVQHGGLEAREIVRELAEKAMN